MGVNGVEDAAAMYNINANAAAGIAGELKAARVLFLTGIRSVDKNMELLKSSTCDDIDGLIKDETITGRMILKGENNDQGFVCCICKRITYLYLPVCKLLIDSWS